MIRTQKIEYQDDGEVLEATIAYDHINEIKKPLVLLFHAWAGKDEFVEKKAQELAKLGYIGCALDIYGKGILGKSKEENAALMSPFMNDRGKLQKRILSYRNLLPSLPSADTSKIGAIGFCFGGLCALDLARAEDNIKGVVSFHGLLDAPKCHLLPNIRSKILVLHGHDDPMVSRSDIASFQKEMDQKNADWQFHEFSHSMHAFTNPQANDPSFGTVYHPVSDKRSWILMKDFFEEVFS